MVWEGKKIKEHCPKNQTLKALITENIRLKRIIDSICPEIEQMTYPYSPQIFSLLKGRDHLCVWHIEIQMFF